jgi:hypothetical protein
LVEKKPTEPKRKLTARVASLEQEQRVPFSFYS